MLKTSKKIFFYENKLQDKNKEKTENFLPSVLVQKENSIKPQDTGEIYHFLNSDNSMRKLKEKKSGDVSCLPKISKWSSSLICSSHIDNSITKKTNDKIKLPSIEDSCSSSGNYRKSRLQKNV